MILIKFNDIVAMEFEYFIYSNNKFEYFKQIFLMDNYLNKLVAYVEQFRYNMCKLYY
jgi:hypothetical protein